MQPARAGIPRRWTVDFHPDRAVEILESTPAAIRALLGGLSDDWTLETAVHGEWTPFDVMGHLLHGERAHWLPRIHRVLEDGPARAFDPFDRFAQFEESKGRTLGELLDQFADLRSRNLATLRGLEIREDQWDLVGTHPSLGPVTLRNVVATWAVHDLNHVGQIAEALARQYDSAVGPWKQYLPILDRGSAAG
jgi:hypothetical protein